MFGRFRLGTLTFMPANEVIAYYEGAYTRKITANLAAALVGGRFTAPLTSYQSGPGLSTTGEGSNLICPGAPAAGGDVAGVLAWDGAINDKVPIISGAGTVVPVKSGAAVAVGNELQVDASGRVIPFTTGKKVGRAHSAVAGADLDVVVELYAAPGAVAAA